MNPRVAPFARIYHLNTSLLLNCVDGLTEVEGRQRLSGKGNGVAGAQRFPIDDSTSLGLITFLAQHEFYHIGQLAFLRRQLGHAAMSYGRAPSARPA